MVGEALSHLGSNSSRGMLSALPTLCLVHALQSSVQTNAVGTESNQEFEKSRTLRNYVFRYETDCLSNVSSPVGAMQVDSRDVRMKDKSHWDRTMADTLPNA